MISSRCPRPIGMSVDGFDACGHGLVHALARDDARRLQLDTAPLLRCNRSQPINWSTKGVDDTAEQSLTNGNIHDGASAFDRVAFEDGAIVAEDHDANVVGLQIEC